MTVGAACHWIMKQTVECYASEISWLTGDQDAIYLYRNSEPDSDLTEWWTASRKRPLWELQVEAIDHAIRFMQTLDRKTARRPYLNVGLAAPEEFESLRKQNLKILEKMKASIEIMREPFRPKMLHLQRAWMGLLPWPTKNPGA
jgi:hypothetical protein